MSKTANKCNSESPIYYDTTMCKSEDFPCYNPQIKKCVNKNNTEIVPECPKDSVADKYKCNNKWPDFPCYKDGSCINKDGVVLMDPIADITYAASELFHGTCNLIYKLLEDADSPKTSRESRIHTYETINNYWSNYGDLMKCPDYLMKAENIRTLPLDTYKKMGDSALIKAKDVINSKLNIYKSKSKTKKTHSKNNSKTHKKSKHSKHSRSSMRSKTRKNSKK
jgi:hypothetical protein